MTLHSRRYALDLCARAQEKGLQIADRIWSISHGSYFEGIKSLPPGHYLKVKDRRISLHQYWDLDFPDQGQERRLVDPAPLVDELEHLMRQSVERRLRGDVPVVSYISGGLDSTVVLGLSSRERGHAVRSSRGEESIGHGIADAGNYAIGEAFGQVDDPVRVFDKIAEPGGFAHPALGAACERA